MPDYEHIRYAVADGILTITLNRPQQLNAFTALMAQESAGGTYVWRRC